MCETLALSSEELLSTKTLLRWAALLERYGLPGMVGESRGQMEKRYRYRSMRGFRPIQRQAMCWWVCDTGVYTDAA